MTGVANGDGTPVTDVFGWQLPDSTGAAGSAASRTPPGDGHPSGESGLPGTGTPAPLGQQDAASGHSVNQPGQNDLGLMGASQDPGYTSTGAGNGVVVSASSHGRFPWQAPAGPVEGS